ncbi:MAG TPA: hypothetical protein VLT33_13835, partial [Labilithrix sp.]|nr:hypothetical protein [Labilithrix sp.]
MTPTTKTMAWLAGAALLIVACGSSSDDAGAGGPAGGSTTPPGETPPAATPTTPPATTPTTPGVPCSGKEALSGDLDWKLTAGGKERVVHVHVPKGYDRAKATPMVLNFHGL